MEIKEVKIKYADGRVQSAYFDYDDLYQILCKVLNRNSPNNGVSVKDVVIHMDSSPVTKTR